MKMARVSWKLRRIGDGAYEGIVTLPASFRQAMQACPPQRLRQVPGGMRALRRASAKRIQVRSRSSTPGGALMNAAGMASRVMSNPLVAAVMPPQAQVAVKALRFAGKAAKAGKLGKALGRMAGPGAKRLVKKLTSWF